MFGNWVPKIRDFNGHCSKRGCIYISSLKPIFRRNTIFYNGPIMYFRIRYDLETVTLDILD